MCNNLASSSKCVVYSVEIDAFHLRVEKGLCLQGSPPQLALVVPVTIHQLAARSLVAKVEVSFGSVCSDTSCSHVHVGRAKGGPRVSSKVHGGPPSEEVMQTSGPPRRKAPSNKVSRSLYLLLEYSYGE